MIKNLGKSPKKKHVNTLFSKDQYAELMRKCKYEVVYMQDKFVDFNEVQKALDFKTKSSEGDRFLISKVKWMRVKFSNRQKLEYKYTNCEEVSPFTMSLQKKSHVQSIVQINCPKLYESAIKIDTKKYKDIMSVMRLVLFI